MSNDTPTPETPIQILRNGQGRFRSDIEELLEKRSLEVVRAVSRVIQDHGTLKKERDEAKAEILHLRAELHALIAEADITDHGDGYIEISRETFNKMRDALNEQP
jgi:predicted RNase H-like nuclease (RuvC/YqgF family)